MDCPSWRQDGHQARSPGPWGLHSPAPLALDGWLCPSCRLRCLLAQRDWGLPFHIMDICTFLTPSQHTPLGLQLQREQGEHTARSSWDVGECPGTGVLFSTSEPQHAMVELAQWPPFPAPSLHRCIACVTTTQANDGALGLRTARTVCGPGACSSLSVHATSRLIRKMFPLARCEGIDPQATWSWPCLIDQGHEGKT